MREKYGREEPNLFLYRYENFLCLRRVRRAGFESVRDEFGGRRREQGQERSVPCDIARTEGAGRPQSMQIVGDPAFDQVSDRAAAHGSVHRVFGRHLRSVSRLFFSGRHSRLFHRRIVHRRHGLSQTTAGIGTNLYLAKIALDITAKHNAEHIGYLDERRYLRHLWGHRPITDFWQISFGTANRLAKFGIYDMRGVANAPEALLYKEFGVNAELLIDHAWGRESCTIADIKQYRSKMRSVSSSQILPRDYSFEEARLVVTEMAQNGTMELVKRHLVAGKVSVLIGYSKACRPGASGSEKLRLATALGSVLVPTACAVFDGCAERDVPIRRLALSFEQVADEGCAGYDLFTDFDAVEREKRRDRTVLELKNKYGKNAVLRGIDLTEAATQRERNNMIGGHRAGYDATGKS